MRIVSVSSFSFLSSVFLLLLLTTLFSRYAVLVLLSLAYKLIFDLDEPNALVRKEILLGPN